MSVSRLLLMPLAVASLATTGCVTTTFNTGLPGGGTKHTETATYFISGLSGDKTINLSEICPEGVASWKDYLTFVDGLLTCVTCYIYAPKTIEVECVGQAGAPKTAYRLTPNYEQKMTRVERVVVAEANHD